MVRLPNDFGLNLRALSDHHRGVHDKTAGVVLTTLARDVVEGEESPSGSSPSSAARVLRGRQVGDGEKSETSNSMRPSCPRAKPSSREGEGEGKAQPVRNERGERRRRRSSSPHRETRARRKRGPKKGSRPWRGELTERGRHEAHRAPSGARCVKFCDRSRRRKQSNRRYGAQRTQQRDGKAGARQGGVEDAPAKSATRRPEKPICPRATE